MSDGITRRDALVKAGRAGLLLALGSTASFLVRKADGQVVWQVDASKCVNSRLGEAGTRICNLCTTECVVSQSAVRAVNHFAKCGRCYICPAYYNIKSAVDEKGLPSEKLCPRDAIVRAPIGAVDPEDPANNFYEYTIIEEKCDGCGICVKNCMEPLGLGSIVLKVRYDLCVDCNRCAISTACPEDAVMRQLLPDALAVTWPERR
jgi:H+/Na+-translocating ferredoxin:NAD+ oxidoreductase subunit B